MLIEVYNESGVRILDNETKVLKPIHEVSLKTPYTVPFRAQNEGDWISDWSIPGYLAGTKAYVEWVVGPAQYYYKTPNPAEGYEIDWVKPMNGTAVLISGILSAVAGNSRWSVIGEGFTRSYTKTLTQADSSGYIDCFNERGELTWSLSVLLKSPQILDVFNAKNVTTLDLTKYPEFMRERIFFSTTCPGEYFVDEMSSSYWAVQVFRDGNIVRFGDLVGNPIDEYVMAAYIPPP
ncbi:hypothetical protein [Acinetobacter baumannii]|uniref:hypothetical protein n=1 Tax=Acinetobacter baumannii TaxID=470 RepID=UPI00338E1232